MTITKVSVHVIENKQRLRGTASVVFDDCLKVRDILILPKDNNGGLYIVMPNKKVGDNRFISLAYPVSADFRNTIENVVLEEYEKQLEKANENLADENHPGEDDDV